MGIKDFFKKVGRGIKRAAGKVWGGIKKGAQFVGKVAKPIINIAKPVLNTLSMLPGKLGMIGKIGSAEEKLVAQEQKLRKTSSIEYRMKTREIN